MKITKNTLIIDALQIGKPHAVAKVLFDFGMPCLGCILANNENIEEAAIAHGIDLDTLLQSLNEACKE